MNKYYLPYNKNTKKVINADNNIIARNKTVLELMEDPLSLTLYCMTYEQAKAFKNSYPKGKQKSLVFRIITFPKNYITEEV